MERIQVSEGNSLAGEHIGRDESRHRKDLRSQGHPLSKDCKGTSQDMEGILVRKGHLQTVECRVRDK